MRWNSTKNHSLLCQNISFLEHKMNDRMIVRWISFCYKQDFGIWFKCFWMFMCWWSLLQMVSVFLFIFKLLLLLTRLGFLHNWSLDLNENIWVGCLLKLLIWTTAVCHSSSSAKEFSLRMFPNPYALFNVVIAIQAAVVH